MKKRLRALIVALALLGGVGVLMAAPAQAIPGIDCKGDPQITSPTGGAAGWLDAGPAHPRSGDPFAKGGATAYEVYGWAGLSWPNYDLGCGPDALRDPASTGAGVIADFMWGMLIAACGAATSVMRWTFDPRTLDVLEPVQRAAAVAFGNKVFLPLFFVTVMVTGLYILFKSGRGNVKDAMHSAGWVLLVTVLAMAAVAWPTRISPTVDRTVTGIVSTVSAGISGDTTGNTSLTLADSVAANIQHGIMFETWKAGMFGRSNGHTADKYGPELFKAAALTRSEAATIEADPSKAKGIYEDHESQFKKVADKIKDEDPEAYEYLAGHHNSSRAVSAFLAWIGWWCAQFFLIVASLLTLFGLVVLRVVIMILPLLAIVAGFPPMRRLLLGVLDYTFGALAAAVMFGSFAVVMSAALSGMLSPTSNIHPLLSLVLMLILTAAAWHVSKPMRRVRTFIDVRQHAQRVWRRGQAPAGETAPNGWLGDDVPNEPGARAADTAPGRYADATPAEASTRKVVKDAVLSGAVQGAAAGVTLAAVSGGTSVAAGAASGAARGAAAAGATAAATQVTGSPTAGAIAATAAGHAITPKPGHSRTLPAGSQGGSTAEDTIATPAPPQTREVHGPTRVYRPDEPSPSDRLELAPTSPSTSTDGQPVYVVFRPQERAQ